MCSPASAHFWQIIKSSFLLLKEMIKTYLQRSWLLESNRDIYWLSFKGGEMPYLKNLCLKGHQDEGKG